MEFQSLQAKISDISKQLPEKTAIEYQQQKVSYFELEKKSNQIANFFNNNPTSSKNHLIIMDRQPALVETILGLLKVGHLFIPVEPGFPEARIRVMMDKAESDWIITEPKYLSKINKISATNEFKTNVLVLNSEEFFDNPYSNLNLYIIDVGIIDSWKPSNEIKNKNCYIYFTSGSTGKPKGILGRHRSLKHFIDWEIAQFKISEEVRVSQLINPSFDASLRDIFVPLCSGGTLCIPDHNDIISDITKIIDWIESKQISLIHMVPSLFRALMGELNSENCFQGLKYILLAGEMLRGNDVKKFFELFGNRIQLINLYGTTETTLIKTYYIVKEDNINRNTIPVGKPITQTEIMILDREMSRCEVGSVGEIYIHTPYISSGYYQDNELTKKVFIRNPFSDNPQDIIYKSGDLGRILPDGNLECLGRIDHQVKIRGIRIELEEIENRLLQYENIKETVVIAKDDGKGGNYLCAYLVATQELSIPDLRSYLSEMLPEYMIPSYFVPIENLPLTPNGKLDRKVLPNPEDDFNPEVGFIAPRDEFEEKLANLWQELLGIKRIGVNDNFFNRGGHSLKAAILMSRVHKLFDIDLPLSEIFINPTVGELAKYIRSGRKSIYQSIQPVAKQTNYPVSSAQKRLYVLHQIAKTQTSYNITGATVIEGKLDQTRLNNIFAELVLRHESFRTSFEISNDELVQRIHPHAKFEIIYLDIDESEVSETIARFIQPFNFGAVPLLKVGIFKISDFKHILIYDMPHIIADGTSQVILIQEFIQLYNNQQLPPIKITYKDFAVWQNRLLKSDIVIKQEAYWRNRLTKEIPLLNMPLDFKRPKSRDFKGNRLRFDISKVLTQRLIAFGSQYEVTMNILLFAIYALLINKYSNQNDLIIGSLVSGRRHTDLENIIGVFINFLPIRITLNPNHTFPEFLETVKQELLNAYENQDLPFEIIVEKCKVNVEPSRNPLFDTMLIFHNEITSDSNNIDLGINHLKFYPYEIRKDATTLDFKMDIYSDIPDELRCMLEYDTALFKIETMEEFIKNFILLCERIEEI